MGGRISNGHLLFKRKALRLFVALIYRQSGDLAKLLKSVQKIKCPKGAIAIWAMPK